MLGEMQRTTSSLGESPSPRPIKSSKSISNMRSTDHQHTPLQKTISKMVSIDHEHKPLETQVNELGRKLAVLDEKMGRKMDGLEAALEKQGKMIKALLLSGGIEAEP